MNLLVKKYFMIEVNASFYEYCSDIFQCKKYNISSYIIYLQKDANTVSLIDNCQKKGENYVIKKQKF